MVKPWFERRGTLAEAMSFATSTVDLASTDPSHASEHESKELLQCCRLGGLLSRQEREDERRRFSRCLFWTPPVEITREVRIIISVYSHLKKNGGAQPVRPQKK